MASFRIKVDLSDYFDDCRKESYIFVKQEWDAIKSIQGHISRLFNLVRNPLLITGDGIYLPPEESIQILNQSDTIKVCRNSPITAPCSEPIPQRKEKFSNRSNSTLLDHCNLPALFSTHETPIVAPAEILKKRSLVGAAQLKKSKLSINFDNPLLDKTQPSEEDEDDDDEEEATTPNLSQKKKRKRVRKRKAKVPKGTPQSTPNGQKDVTNGGYNGQLKNGKKPGKRQTEDVTTEQITNKHTKFDKSDPETSSSDDEVVKEVKQQANVSVKFREQKLPNVSRIIKGIRTSCPVVAGMQTRNAAAVEKEKANGKADDMVVDCNIEDSDDSDDEEEVELEEEEPEKASFLNGSQDANKTADLDALRKNLASYPALDTLPNKNDFIGFRMLKLGDNYVPQLTEFIIGLVESVDPDTMAMEIVILAGNDELKQHQEGGKFSLPDCNDTLVNIDDRTLCCNWVELKDVRLVDVSLLA